MVDVRLNFIIYSHSTMAFFFSFASLENLLWPDRRAEHVWHVSIKGPHWFPLPLPGVTDLVTHTLNHQVLRTWHQQGVCVCVQFVCMSYLATKKTLAFSVQITSYKVSQLLIRVAAYKSMQRATMSGNRVTKIKVWLSDLVLGNVLSFVHSFFAVG